MAKKLFNPTQRKHMEEEIEFIFARIEFELFSREMFAIANQLECKPNLIALQTALKEFKDALIIETRTRKDDFSLNTARQLDITLDTFFFKSEPHEKNKIINQFYNVARNAWFSRFTKTAGISIPAGIGIFVGILILMIATGGVGLLGVGTVISISFIIGLVAGGIAAFAGYQLSANPHERRGREVRDALRNLNEHIGLPIFIIRKNHAFMGEPRFLLIQAIKDSISLARKNQKKEPAPVSSTFTRKNPSIKETPSTFAKIRQQFKQFFLPTEIMPMETPPDVPVAEENKIPANNSLVPSPPGVVMERTEISPPKNFMPQIPSITALGNRFTSYFSNPSTNEGKKSPSQIEVITINPVSEIQLDTSSDASTQSAEISRSIEAEASLNTEPLTFKRGFNARNGSFR